MPHRATGGFLWRNLAVVALVLTVLGGTVLAIKVEQNSNDAKTLARENQQRIVDIDHEARARDAQIQRSRVVACRKIYASVAELFHPFFPSPPTPIILRFERRVKTLQDRCPKQTRRHR
jgi:hypothetical protein